MDDVKLITLVEGKPILYNKKSYDYKNQNKKCNAWQNIADSLGQEVEQVKSRWVYLRQRFSRERARSTSGAEATDEWELMKYMRFLDPVVAVRRTTSNYQKSKQAKCSQIENPCKRSEALQFMEMQVAVSDDDVAIESCGTLSRASMQIFSPTSAELHSPEEEIFSPEPELFSPMPGTSRDDGDFVATPTARSLGNPKKRSAKCSAEEPPQKQIFTTLQTTLQSVNTLIEKKKGPTANSDEIFGQFVASRLSLLDEAEKKEKMKDIFNILMN